MALLYTLLFFLLRRFRSESNHGRLYLVLESLAGVYILPPYFFFSPIWIFPVFPFPVLPSRRSRLKRQHKKREIKNLNRDKKKKKIGYWKPTKWRQKPCKKSLRQQEKREKKKYINRDKKKIHLNEKLLKKRVNKNVKIWKKAISCQKRVNFQLFPFPVFIFSFFSFPLP